MIMVLTCGNSPQDHDRLEDRAMSNSGIGDIVAEVFGLVMLGAIAALIVAFVIYIIILGVRDLRRNRWRVR